MSLFSKKIRQELETIFSQLEKDVELLFFSQEFECRFCRETREMLEELPKISEKIILKIFDFQNDAEIAKEYKIDKIPAIVVKDSQKDSGIRFFGIPSGYEFSSLIEAIRLVSTSRTNLAPETVEFLKNLQSPVNLQVFVTPTCPYCPGAVILAQQMAYVSEQVSAAMVEATEFPQLASRYNVFGVPKTIINEKEFVEGMVPEKELLTRIKSVV